MKNNLPVPVVAHHSTQQIAKRKRSNIYIQIKADNA